MGEQDYDAFADLWQAAWESMGRNPTVAAIEFAYRVLRDCELSAVKAAVIAHARDHSRRGSYPPSPADILYQLQAMRGMENRPGPDEAWALLAHDERSTCVWTEDMQAAYSIAAPLLAEGDRIAARMAFRQAYEREVRRAEAEGCPVRWSVSLGWDKAGREGPIREALDRGRLTIEQALEYLPTPEGALIMNDVLMLTKGIGKKALRESA